MCRYEDGMSTVRKVCLASDFVWSETPLEVLGSVTSVTFDDPACSSMRENPLTTEEVMLLATKFCFSSFRCRFLLVVNNGLTCFPYFSD